MKFVPTKKFKEFWTDGDVDISKLGEEIRIALGVKRWEESPTKEGFSGISVESDHLGKEKNRHKKHRIVVHWTLDGEFGFNIDFPPNLVGIINSIIAKHKADNPLRGRPQAYRKN